MAKKKKPELKFTTILITPHKAGEWLEKANMRNRKICESVVVIFTRDMINGDWIFNHQPIAFDKHGNLVDGQHRLAAVVRSGVSIWMVVCFDSTRDGIDIGRRRSIADIITLQGDHGKVTNFDMATLRAMLRGVSGFVSKSVAEMVRLYDKHKEAIYFAKRTVGDKNRIPGITTGTTRAVIARAFYSQDLEKLEHFCQVLRTADFRGSDDNSIRLLWTFLVTSGNSGNGSIPLKERYCKTERALSAHLNGEKITKLFSSPKELFPLPSF